MLINTKCFLFVYSLRLYGTSAIASAYYTVGTIACTLGDIGIGE